MSGETSGRETLGPLLHALAESLDVGEIFARISAAARRIVPHDFLMLGLLSEDRQHVRVRALSGEVPEEARELAYPDALVPLHDLDVIVLNDMRQKPGAPVAAGWLRRDGGEAREPIEIDVTAPLFRELFGRQGLCSYMRVVTRLRGEVLGELVFCSNDAEAFPPGDVAGAQQIADCVALALSHQRLAEARERAERLEIRVRRLSEELEAQGRHRVLGGSKKWKDVLAQAAKVAATEATVLLCGESGTGKEVVARFIHRASPRAEGPFVALNCAALPTDLLESELFGHEKGAFTGALAARAGKVEQAAGGTLFLDEIGEMASAVQAKLLRVLQEREFQRLGGSRTLKADIRVLAATNRDLKAAIANGGFREDLYYRIAVFDLALPPLRERPEDVLVLVDAFLDEIGRTIGRPAAGVSEEVRDTLVRYPWPGNVRELRNAIERAMILCEGGLITSEHLPIGIAAAVPNSAPPPASVRGGTLDAAEREMIVAALARAGGNKSKAARALGLTRAQLRSRIEKHGLGAEGD